MEIALVPTSLCTTLQALCAMLIAIQYQTPMLPVVQVLNLTILLVYVQTVTLGMLLPLLATSTVRLSTIATELLEVAAAVAFPIHSSPILYQFVLSTAVSLTTPPPLEQ